MHPLPEHGPLKIRGRHIRTAGTPILGLPKDATKMLANNNPTTRAFAGMFPFGNALGKMMRPTRHGVQDLTTSPARDDPPAAALDALPQQSNLLQHVELTTPALVNKNPPFPRPITRQLVVGVGVAHIPLRFGARVRLRTSNVTSIHHLPQVADEVCRQHTSVRGIVIPALAATHLAGVALSSRD